MKGPLSPFFEVRNPPLHRGEPVFEFRCRIAPENALAGKCLAEAVDMLFDLFVVPIDLVVERIDFAIQRLDVIAEFRAAGAGSGSQARPRRCSLSRRPNII
jgi:hypothetical protein